MRQDSRDDFQAWLWGEILLFGLLGSSLALFVTNHQLQTKFSLPQLGLVLQTVMAFAGGIIALLAGIRFAVEGRRLDLFLCTGFLVASVSIVAFAIAPVLDGQPVHRAESWAGVAGRLFAWALIAAAPFVVRPASWTFGLPLWHVLAAAPYLFFGVMLGGSLWYVARRLYGNAGGYIALLLYCFSPAMIAGVAGAQGAAHMGTS